MTLLPFPLQVGRLRQWQQQVPSLQQVLSTTAAASQLQPPLRRLLPASTKLLPQEFGSNLDVKVLEGPAAMSWFIPVVAASGSGSTAASRRQQQQQQMAAMAGGAATPAELRQVWVWVWVCAGYSFRCTPVHVLSMPHTTLTSVHSPTDRQTHAHTHTQQPVDKSRP